MECYRRIYYSPRNRKLQISDLELVFGPYHLTLRLEAPAPMKFRRTILLACFRQLRHLIDDFDVSSITHWDEKSYNKFDIDPPSLSSRQAPLQESEDQRLGLKIRLIRNRLGLTQSQMAKRAGISRSHLAEIERGKHRARPRVLAKLTKADI